MTAGGRDINTPYIGVFPDLSSYVTQSSLSSQLANYETAAAHAADLANYTSTTGMNAAIAAAVSAVVQPQRFAIVTQATSTGLLGAALGELFGTATRTIADFRAPFNNTSIRLVVNVTGLVLGGLTVALQYSTDQATWNYFSGSTPAVSLASPGIKDSGWAAIPAGARAGEVYLRLVSQGGNGLINPTISRAEILAK